MTTTDAATSAHGQARDAPIAARSLMQINISFKPVPTYETALGTRMNFVVEEGRAVGDGLSAEVLPGSADWLIIGKDLVAQVDVRATLLTDDGAHIYMTNSGRVSLGEQADRFFAGEVVTSEDAYIRTAPLFETAHPTYAHLGRTVSVAYCDISLTSITYRIYALD